MCTSTDNFCGSCLLQSKGFIFLTNFNLFVIQNEKIAKKTLHLIDRLGTSLLATKVTGEKPSVFTTDKLSLTLDRQTPAKMSRKSLGEEKERVALPSAEVLFGSDFGIIPSVDAQVQF